MERPPPVRVPDHQVNRSGHTPTQSEALTSTVCIALTLVVMFALMVTLQIYLVESSTIQDLLGFNMSFNTDTLFVSNATKPTSRHAPTTFPVTAKIAMHSTLAKSPSTTTTWATLFAETSTWKKKRLTTRVPTDLFTLSTDTMYQRYRSLCVYKARSRGRTRGGFSYGIDAFPYHLCTDAVYCCASIDPRDVTVKPGDASMDVFKEGFRKFRALKAMNAYLRVWIAIGGCDSSTSDRETYTKIARDESLGLQFAANVVDWLETHAYDGAFLYWKYPEIHEANYLIDLLRIMKDSFRRLGLSVGVVVPLDHQLRERFDMRELVDLMDDYSIMVDPTDPSPRPYGRTALKWTQDIVDRYAEVFRETQYTVKGHKRSGKFQLCYPLLLDATAYSLFAAAEDNTTKEGIDASGPGMAGHSSKVPGRLAFDELCLRKRWDIMEEQLYCRVALYGNQWVSFPTPYTLEAFARALMKATGTSRCLGVWDPSWDDFAGHCHKGPYPLTATLFHVERSTGTQNPRPKQGVT